MFVVIADLKIKKDEEEAYKKTFVETNKFASKFDGFVSRRLLEKSDGSHRILVEFENAEKYGKMHQSPEFDRFQIQSFKHLDILPVPLFYEIIAQ